MNPVSPRAATACIGVGVAVPAVLAAMGWTAAVGPGGRGGPWPLSVRLDVEVATIVCALALVAGGVGVGTGLTALRRGWTPRLKLWLPVALGCVAILALLPPAGSQDTLYYAVFGRTVERGLSPYTTTPADLRGLGDPVALLTSGFWDSYPSVYGPLATFVQWGTAYWGGASAAWTIWAFKLAVGASYAATALCLDRLAAPDPERRARVLLLWTLNPVLLWNVVVAGRVDALGAVLLVAALAAGRRSAFLAGVLGTAAFAVKAPFGAVLLALAWNRRRSVRSLLGLAGGAAVVAAGCAAFGGVSSLTAPLARLGFGEHTGAIWRMLPDALTPWAVLVRDLGVLTALSLTVALVLAWSLARGLPEEPRPESADARLTLSLGLGWLLTTPTQHPWYDALTTAPLSLVRASALDWLLVGRMTVLTVTFLPGAASGPAYWSALSVLRPASALVVLVAALAIVMTSGRRCCRTPRARAMHPVCSE